MKVKVDQDLCISCGLCISICPEVFDWNDNNKAQEKMEEVPSGLESQAKEAVEGCPTEAIKEV
ncbi:MAG TPA: ferredoxin [Clostridia bacterium]|jgi:ferredoxin|nr:ferredoxin [Clostridia bacterium]